MDVQVVFTPAYLGSQPLDDKAVVVFDVLRATTTITAALAAGITGVRVFAELEEAKVAAARQSPRPILLGEKNALPAPGVDLGNSPGQFRREHTGREIFMSTTNGTRALVAARPAAATFAGALVNAGAVARAAAATSRDILLLGSGTDGTLSMEDVIGAGAVCQRLLEFGNFSLADDGARMAHRLFLGAQDHLPAELRLGQGGRNIIRAGLEPDIDFSARLDVLNVVGQLDADQFFIRRIR